MFPLHVELYTYTRCRKGSADVLVNFDDLCPSSTMLVNNEEAESCSKNGVLENYQICGKEVPRGYWVGYTS